MSLIICLLLEKPRLRGKTEGYFGIQISDFRVDLIPNSEFRTLNCCCHIFYLLPVAYFSETYHESIKYGRQVSGDPVTLHWENSGNVSNPYAAGKRYASNGVKAGQRKKAASEDGSSHLREQDCT